jgi:hypothetical protein
LRWGTEEAFWEDLFHSSKEELPWQDEIHFSDRRSDRRGKRSTLRILGKFMKIEYDDDDWNDPSRVFIARFGDIDEITATGDNHATLLMKSGTRIDVSGYANDVSDAIHVNDDTLGEFDLHWDRIETIEFMPAPRGADPGETRLYGKAETHSGDFEGFIQWDKQECLGSDLLDGDTRDGDVSIRMDRITSIERRGRNSSIVELKDGRTLRLRDSNDVDSDNRGIMVEDPRYGRLTIPWDEFDRLTFSDPPGSGRGYDDFPPTGKLKGAVTDVDGDTYRGRLVIDLDEEESWEILNGSYRDITFDIPLINVKAIEPRRHDESLVILRSGEEILLEDGQDVSDKNDGVLIFTNGDDPVYLDWRDVERIEFEH